MHPQGQPAESCRRSTLELKTTGGGLDQKDIQQHDGNNQHHQTTVGGETYMEYWWVDDWYYMGENMLTYSGSYFKGYVTWEYYLENYLKTSDTTTFINYPISWFEDLSIKKQGNNYYLEAMINGEKVSPHFGNSTGATISNVSVQINIDSKGAFKAITLKYTQTQYGHDYNFTSTGTFTNVGTTVVVGPENPDAFTEMTIMPVQ